MDGTSTTSSTPLQVRAGERGFKEEFFRRFQHETTALQEQIDRIEDAAVASGERSALIEECLAGIARLSTSVQDASSALPTYDMRMYSEGIKTLSERLQQIRAVYAPKQKFSFRTRRNEIATASTQPVRRSMPPLPPMSTAASSSTTTTTQSSPSVKPAIDNLSIADRSREHIVLPAYPTPTSRTISLANLERCVLQSSPGSQFTSLTLNSIHSSLLVIPLITGPAHMSNMTNTTLILQSRQFRLHSCKDIDVYLYCSSRPIIEDCQGIRFAPLSEELKRLLFGKDEGGAKLNQWDQVDDFKWIRTGEQSPNWRTLRGDEMIDEGMWREVLVLAEGENVSTERVEEVLKLTLPARRG